MHIYYSMLKTRKVSGMFMPGADLHKWQNKVLVLCWFGYASAYLCRTNLAIALPGIISSQGWSKTDAGLIGTMFFWAYAVGQLINGFIGDKVKSRPFVFIGLFASAVINLCVGFASSLMVVAALWCVNGFFLSTLWGPIIKTISVWFPPEKRTRIAVIMSMSMVGGYLFTWGILGQVVIKLSWRWAFWIPAAVVFLYSLVWLVKMRNSPEEVGLQSLHLPLDSVKADGIKVQKQVSFTCMLIDSKLWLVAITCVAEGVIKEGIPLWAPTLLRDTQNLSPEAASLFSLVIPAMSLFGILGAGWLLKLFRSNEVKVTAVLVSCAAVVSVLLYNFLQAGPYVTVILLSITLALMYGTDTILLTIIPLSFGKYNRVSTVAGFLDFSSYLGAAAAGVLMGSIIDHLGWRYVVLCWIVLALVGVICILPAGSRNRKQNEVCVE